MIRDYLERHLSFLGSSERLSVSNSLRVQDGESRVESLAHDTVRTGQMLWYTVAYFQFYALINSNTPAINPRDAPPNDPLAAALTNPSCASPSSLENAPPPSWRRDRWPPE